MSLRGAIDDGSFRRPLIGGLAAACLAAVPLVYASRGWNNMVTAGLIRVGIVLACAWMAWPSIEKLSLKSLQKGGLVVAVGLLVLAALRPRVFGPLLVLGVVWLTWRRLRGRE